ncbi:MAG: helix-turn-helix domain-containing protein [Actinomycetota bacterium]|nr:helix-turn-helix domain-containing protein [Actinomycetota bacterium]
MPLDRYVPQPAALRALSHPVRLRLLGLLRSDGPSTATRLAERLGLNSGATSYHLRQLAAHGYVAEDTERGTGRDRWWRSVHRSTWTDEEGGDQAGRDAVDALVQGLAVVHTEQLQRAVEERQLLPPEWRRASTISDWRLHLDPEQAHTLLEELVALLETYRSQDPEPEDAPPGTAQVIFQLHAFPRPGTVARGDDGEEPA